MNVFRMLRLLGILAGLAGVTAEARAQVGSPAPGTTYDVDVTSTLMGDFQAEMTFTETSAEDFLNILSFREGSMSGVWPDGFWLFLDKYEETNINLGGLQFSVIDGFGPNSVTEFAAVYVALGPLVVLNGSATRVNGDEVTFSSLQFQP